MSPFAPILYEDEHCLGLLKPAGQLSQGVWTPRGETTLEQVVRTYLSPESPDTVYLGIVHRLDRPVSGLLLWAKTPKAARRLSMQFEKRQAVKEYWAIVEATDEGANTAPAPSPLPTPGEEWVDWLTGADQDGHVHSVPEGTPRARLARTRTFVDSEGIVPAGLQRLRLWPESGRTHQLRVQAAVRGTPILGDAHYGARRDFSPGIALHARSLQLRHPTTSAPLILTAPLPSSWKEQGIDLDPQGG